MAASPAHLWLLERRHVIVSDFSDVPKVTPKVPPGHRRRRRSAWGTEKKKAGRFSRALSLFGSVVASRLRTKNLLTSQKNLELLVVELHLSLGDEAALCALPHRVHETHAGQLHLLTAALITETPAAPPTVMLQEIGATVRLTAVKRKCLHTHSVCVSHETQLS